MPCLKAVPGKQDGNLGPTPLGLETAAPCQPRAAQAVEGSERRWNLLKSKVPALHREAERDTTGRFSRQPPVHTWIGAGVQGKRRSTATLRVIRRNCVKLRLTLWFYCGKRAARRHGFVGEPRKSWGFAEVCASVHCSIAVFRCHNWRSGRGIFFESDRGVEFFCRFRRPPGRRQQANPLCPRSRQDDPVSRLYAGRPVSGGGGHPSGQLSTPNRDRYYGAR